MNDNSTNDHSPLPADQGRAARKAGVLRADNPYEPGSLKAKFWTSGWDTPDWSGVVVDGSDLVQGQCFNKDRMLGSYLRSTPQHISAEVDVISAWDAIQWMAFGCPQISYPPVPLNRLMDEDADSTLSAVDEAALKVAASTLRRYCAMGIVLCGFVDEDFDDYDAPIGNKAFLFDKDDFKKIGFLWDGSIEVEGGSLLACPDIIFVVYDEFCKIMSSCEDGVQIQEKIL